MNRHNIFALFVIIIIICIFILSIIDDFLPAGCPYFNFVSAAGGCTETTKTLSLSIKPKITCISLHESTCVEPTDLLIQNNCNEPIFIQNITILEGMEYSFIENSSRLLSKFELPGKIGNQSFTISYIKTGPLCS